MTDCIYYQECNGAGFCAKGLPNTPCEIKGCVAYYPKGEALFCENKMCPRKGICDKVNCTDRIPKPLKDKI